MKKTIRLKRFFVRGHWIDTCWIYTDTGKISYDCSVCHFPAQERYQFCPHCGAKMDESEDKQCD